MTGFHLVIPMAGRGSRFSVEGYDTPKPLLPVGRYRMFEVVVANLASSQLSELTLISREGFSLREDCEKLQLDLGINVNLIELDYVTQGPAETVSLALRDRDGETPLVVANSDQFLDFSAENWMAEILDSDSAGSILCMRDSDPKWSYAELSQTGLVSRVREKEVISELATCGVYFFRTEGLFLEAFRHQVNSDDRVNGEFYVAPLYNHLISKGLDVCAFDLGPVSEVMFGLGTPEDYVAFTRNPQLVQKSDDLCAARGM